MAWKWVAANCLERDDHSLTKGIPCEVLGDLREKPGIIETIIFRSYVILDPEDEHLRPKIRVSVKPDRWVPKVEGKRLDEVVMGRKTIPKRGSWWDYRKSNLS